MTSKTVTIIGEGLSSLMLSKVLLNKGKKVVLIELVPDAIKFNSIGVGSSVSGIGVHNYYISSENTQDFLKKEFDLELIKDHQENYLLINGNYLTYPLSLISIIRAENIWFFIRAFFSYLRSIVTRIKIESYQDLVIKAFGKVLYRYYFERYIINEYKNVSPESIDKELAKRRIKYTSLTKIITNIFQKSTKSYYNSDKYYFPKTGINEYLKTINQQLQDNTNFTRHNASVTHIVRNHDSTYTLKLNDNNHQTEFNTDLIFANQHLNTLSSVLGLKQQVSEDWIPIYVVCYKVNGYSQGCLNKQYYIADTSIEFYQVNVNCRISKNGTKQTLITGFISGNNTNVIADKIKNNAVNSLVKMGIISSVNDIADVSYNIIKHGKPVLLIGKYHEFEQLKHTLKNEYNIQLFGERSHFREYSFYADVEYLDFINNSNTF